MGHILVAEDEPHILLLLQRMLEGAGYTVVTTMNGDEALEIAHQDKPDLMVLDIMLPDHDGREICREIKERYGNDAPPVILISALGQQLDVEAGIAAGADDYLIKPFSPRQLLERVEKALHQRR